MKEKLQKAGWILLVILLFVLLVTKTAYAADDETVSTLEIDTSDTELKVEFLEFETHEEMIAALCRRVVEEKAANAEISIYGTQYDVEKAQAKIHYNTDLDEWMNIGSIMSDGASPDIWFSINNDLDHLILIVDK